MDDEHVAGCVTRDVLADAAAEQALEKSGFARTDDDQLCLPALSGVDELLRRVPGYPGELDVQVSVGEQRLDPLAMLFPELLVALGPSTELLRRIAVVRHQAERTGNADV